MNLTRDESIRQQQDALAQILHEPIAQIANDSIALWSRHSCLENILLVYFSRIPYCAGLYALDTAGKQITEYVTRDGAAIGTIGCNHTDQPYMRKLKPAQRFLLSDIYFNQRQHFLSFTAIQIVSDNDDVLGYIGADFDLRDLPLTSEWFQDETN